MRLWGKLALVIVASGVLAGCQQKAAPASKADSSSSKTSKVVQAPTKKLAWSSAKAQRLETFMGEFGVKMQQNYTAVTTKTSTSWNDIDLSTYIRQNKRVRFGDKATKVNWLPKATAGSTTAANIVAVDADDADKILYLFEVTADGTAHVWVSETGLDDGLLQMKETTNHDLTSGFKQIVAGKTPSLLATDSSSSSSSQASSSSRQVASSSQSSSSSSQSTTTKSTNHAVVFDQQYQHTWYSYSAYDHKVHTQTFAANSIIMDNGTPQPVYSINERTAADKAYLQSTDAGNPPDQAKMSWGAAMNLKDTDGVSYINVRGWYQTAGAGGYYRIATRNLDGQSQPVLETASGAGMWVDSNYYLTRALAEKYQDQKYPDEHTMN
ncbi:DUF4767 domain-containing protein [Lacticaseibacillus sp. GG6-2]